MKRLVIFVITISMLLSLVGCGRGGTKSNEETLENTQFEQREEPTNETNTIPIKEEIKLSDGPIFFNGDSNSFTLTHYSLKSGKRTEIFKFDSQNKYRLATDPCKSWGNYYHKQLFDSKLERIAVSWYEGSDGSSHVGWLNKNGDLTDVTNIVHPATTGFSGVSPRDTWAFFTSDDMLIFYDNNSELYCYYDDVSNAIVETYDITKNATPKMTTKNYYQAGLNPQNRPTTDGDFYCGETCYSTAISDEGSCEYVFDGNEYTILGIMHVNGQKAIVHYGPGLTEPDKPNSYSYDVPTYTSNHAIRITPETEYNIQFLAYCNNTIVFTATKGTERTLFKMTYNDRVAGEPESIATIDSSWGSLFFWSDNDTPIHGIHE